MPKIYKCTRCGDTFADNDYLKDTYDTATKLGCGGMDTRRKHLSMHHLCPTCSRDFFHWLWSDDRYKLVKTKKYKKELKKKKKENKKKKELAEKRSLDWFE